MKVDKQQCECNIWNFSSQHAACKLYQTCGEDNGGERGSSPCVAIGSHIFTASRTTSLGLPSQQASLYRPYQHLAAVCVQNRANSTNLHLKIDRQL
jgi:hypothetical protein